MNERGKLLFFDIDGTLKPVGKPLHPTTVETLHRLAERGHLPIVCTGRTYASAMENDWMQELPFAGIVCAAGAQVVFRGETVHEITLTGAESARLGEMLLECGAQFMLEGASGLGYHPSQAETTIPLWRHIFGETVPMQPMRCEDGRYQKAVAKGCEKLRPRGYLAELEQRYRMIWYDDHEHLAEIVPKEVSKATGILALLSHLGMDLSDTYAFGDGPNDLEMLRLCGHSVVMSNGHEEAKAEAEFVTGPCDGTGIRDACLHFGLI